MSSAMYPSYIQRAAERYYAFRQRKLTTLNGRTDAERRQEDVRTALRRTLGAFPEVSPLDVRQVHRIERDGYNVEVLTYQSQPGLVVTANLYLPKNRSTRVPGVVCPVGHWVEGKAQHDYQMFAQALARRGMAALVLDGIGQGERIQYYDVTLRRSWVGSSAEEDHAQLAYALFLSGDNLTRYMAWDALRGLELLAQHEEIDPGQLAAAGAGSGGMLVRYLCALEPRLAAAVSLADGIDAHSLMGGDAERNLEGLWPDGISPLDLYQPFAPRPLLLGYNCEERPDSLNHVNQTELAGFWAHFGSRERVEAFAHPGPQVFFKELRERAVEFLAKVFGLPGDKARGHEHPPEPAAQLNATETGQVTTALVGPDVFELNHRRVHDLPPPPPDFGAPSPENALKLQDHYRDLLRKHLRLPEPQATVDAQVEARSSDWGLAVEKGRLVVEEGIYLPYAFYSEPESSEGRVARPVVMTVHDRGRAAIGAQGEMMTRLASGGRHVMAIDARGVGETHLQSSGDNGNPYRALLLGTESEWAAKALNVGLSLFGGRVFDVLRTASYLRTRHDARAQSVSLVGVARGALWTLYAAALDPKIAQVVLVRGLSDYKSLVDHRRQNHHPSLFLPGLIKDFDLPHVAACVAPRTLVIINAVNQRREALPVEDVATTYRFTAEIYKQLDAAENFRVLNTASLPETIAALDETLETLPPGSASGWPD